MSENLFPTEERRTELTSMSSDGFRDEIYMLFHGGRRKVLGYRNDSMLWMLELNDMSQTLDSMGLRQLREWERSHVTGDGTRGTHHWPGWYKRGLRFPPVWGRKGQHGIGAPRSYFEELPVN